MNVKPKTRRTVIEVSKISRMRYGLGHLSALGLTVRVTAFDPRANADLEARQMVKEAFRQAGFREVNDEEWEAT